MLRALARAALAAVLLMGPASATIWTEEYFGFERQSLETLRLPESPLWEEYGFEEAERAVYEKGDESFRITAWRFNDSTSALAVFQWKHPTEYRPSDLDRLAVESEDSLYIARGNYVLHFEGRKPSIEELQGLYLVLPRSDHSALPTLAEYLPQEDRMPGSARFVIGPAGLREFEPRIPPSVAAFQYGTEVQLGRYQTSAGELGLAIIAYPTHHIARDRLAEFRMLPNTLVKRSGPLLVVALDPPDPDVAQVLLGRVNYRATITWDEILPVREWTMVELFLTIGVLCGLLAGFAVAAGLAFAGYRRLQDRWATGTAAGDPMIMLHLEDK